MPDLFLEDQTLPEFDWEIDEFLISDALVQGDGM